MQSLDDGEALWICQSSQNPKGILLAVFRLTQRNAWGYPTAFAKLFGRVACGVVSMSGAVHRCVMNENNATSGTLPVTRADLCASPGPQLLVDRTLDEGDFHGLDLRDVTFERCSMRRVRFDGASLNGVRLLNCRGGESSFVGADLDDAIVSGGDFNNASFCRAKLTSTRFERCKLTGADFTDAGMLGVTLEEVLLSYARLPGMAFRKSTFRQVDFSEADLRKCDFRMAVFEDSSLRNASLDGCRFEQADLRGADLGGVELMDARLFRGAVISRVQAAELLSQLGLRVF